MKKRAVVLVPAYGPIEPECERSLRGLESRGYEVRRVTGYAAIDQARSQMATDALADGFDELLWIDTDIAFAPDDIEKLRAHDEPMICALYPKKGQRALASHLLPETKEVVFGAGGGKIEILYAATGFLLTHRRVYEDVKRTHDLPTCNERFGKPLVPYFLPAILTEGVQHWYLGEDFAFSERARRAGYKVMADTTIRLFHIGRAGASWEEAGSDAQRFATYTFSVRT